MPRLLRATTSPASTLHNGLSVSQGQMISGSTGS